MLKNGNILSCFFFDTEESFHVLLNKNSSHGKNSTFDHGNFFIEVANLIRKSLVRPYIFRFFQMTVQKRFIMISTTSHNVLKQIVFLIKIVFDNIEAE